MDNRRKIIDTIDVDGKPLKLAVLKPTNKINQEANMAYNLRMASLIRSGSQNSNNRLLLRAELEEYLVKMGIWSMEDSLKVEKLAIEIRAYELMLKKGGIKLSEGRTIALKMAEKRQEIMMKHSKRQAFDSATIESQAENFRFEFLLIKCLVSIDDGISYIRNHNSYIDRQDEIAVVDGAKALANIVYGLEESIHHNMFEMQWLKQAGMIDDDGRYVKADGTMTDRNGRLVNKDGRYINDEGQMVDTFGRPVDEHGNLLVDISEPFIDDDSGKPIIVCDIGAKTKITKKTQKSTKKTKTKKKVNKTITDK